MNGPLHARVATLREFAHVQCCYAFKYDAHLLWGGGRAGGPRKIAGAPFEKLT